MSTPSFDAKAELRKLPQFPFIDERRIDKWIDRVMSIDPERIEWHVRRLSGIGGSEIGVLVGALRGYYHPHSSDTELVGHKLLHVLPTEPNGDMLRGQVLEPVARDIYRKQILERFPQAIPRDDIIENLGKFRDEKRPWLIGTPDEVMEVEPGKIWIIDYKCPTPDALAEYAISGVPFYYAAQLHHYRFIAQKMGYQIDGLQLASLDMKKWRMDLRDVPYDAALEAECLFAGDHYWTDFVMQGRIPSTNASKRYGEATDIHDNLREGAILYTLWGSIGNHFAKRQAQIGDRVRDANLTLDPSVDSVSVGIVDIKAEREFDEDGMAKALEEQGVDASNFTQEGDWDVAALLDALIKSGNFSGPDDPRLANFRQAATFDTKAMQEQFRKLGLDMSPFIQSETIKFGLSRSKTPYAEHIRSSLKEIVESSSKQYVDTVRDKLIAAETQWHATDLEQQASRVRARPRKP